MFHFLFSAPISQIHRHLALLQSMSQESCAYTVHTMITLQWALWGVSPVVLVAKKSACQCRRWKRPRFDPWARKMPMEEGMATHSSISAWRIPWIEEPGGLQSIGHKELDMTKMTEHACMWALWYPSRKKGFIIVQLPEVLSKSSSQLSALCGVASTEDSCLAEVIRPSSGAK